MVNMLDSLLARFGIIGAVIVYFWQRKLFWLLPALLLLMVLGILLVFAEATGVGPFIYTLF